MKNSKNMWLRATLGLTLALGIGYYAVNASEKKAAAEKVKAEIEAELLDPIYKWYQLEETTDSEAEDQTLASLTPMSSPPPATDAFNCAQNSTAAKYCAVVIEFPPLTSNFTLTDFNLQDAIDNHPVTISIAPAADANGDGYSRKP